MLSIRSSAKTDCESEKNNNAWTDLLWFAKVDFKKLGWISSQDNADTNGQAVCVVLECFYAGSVQCQLAQQSQWSCFQVSWIFSIAKRRHIVEVLAITLLLALK